MLAIRRQPLSLIVLSYFIASGCAEHPLQPKAMLEVAGRRARSVTCTTEWREAVSGSWSDPTRWTTNVPGPSDNACVLVEGAYVVSVTGTQSVNSITIGAGGPLGVPTVSIEGIRPGSGFSTDANVTVATDVFNDGRLRLTSVGNRTSGAAVLTIPNGALYNRAGAVFESREGSGGWLALRGHLVNDGTAIIEYELVFDHAGATIVNRGDFTVVSGPFWALRVRNGAGFTQAGGVLRVPGLLDHTGGTFALDGGTIDGVPTLSSATLAIGASSTATGTVRVTGASSLTGDVKQGQAILIEGIRPMSTGSATEARLTSAAAFTNHGTIRMISTGNTGSGQSTLAISSGALTNAATGVITTEPGQGGFRYITGNLVNDGLIDVDAETQLGAAGATYVNNGRLKVRPYNNSPQSGHVAISGGVFIQAGGSLELDGPFEQSWGSFRFDGGNVTSGPPLLWHGALVIGDSSTAQGTVRVRGSNTLTGNVRAGQTIEIDGFRSGCTGLSTEGRLTVTGDYANAGRIRLTDSGCAGSGAYLATATDRTLTNLASGVIESHEGARGVRGFEGNITNQGTIEMPYSLQHANGTLRTTGSITGGQFLYLLPSSTFYGSGTVTAHIENQGVVHVGQSPGRLVVNGEFRQGNYGYGWLVVELGGPVDGTGFDRLHVRDGVRLGGGISVIAAPGVCVDPGLVYEFLTYPSATGDFYYKYGDLGGGRTAALTFNPTRYTATTSGPPCPVPDNTPPAIVPTVTGTLGDNGWYVGDVTLAWTITDAESAVTSTTGCEDRVFTNDLIDANFTCTATSAGGTASRTVTINRDATPPEVDARRSEAPNADGWYNRDVYALFNAIDQGSGVSGMATSSQLFSAEGTGFSATRTFRDVAGNSTTVTVDGINIDKTGPVVTSTRSPLPDADGWNSTNVTVTFTATDALAGIAGDASATLLFSQEGANQSGSRTFTDRAGNSTTSTVTGISIRRDTPPPPPPPAVFPTCSANPATIWPPTNKLVPVAISFSFTSGMTITLRSATSNEPGSADIDGFVAGTFDVTGSVRASRSGSGTGRVYTFTYDLRDAYGRTSSCSATVAVPHDQRKG